MPEVKCKVKPCHYWKDGDICGAKSIMVDFNKKNTGDRMEVSNLDFDVGRAASRARDFDAAERGLVNTRMTDSEMGDLTGSFGGSTSMGPGAKTSEETLCATFRPKDAQFKH